MILAIGGGVLLLLLFCGGAAVVIGVLVFAGRQGPIARKEPPVKDLMPPPNPPPMKDAIAPPPPAGGGGQPVQARLGPITKLQLKNGQVQVQAQLTFQDPLDSDPDARGHRAKLYQVDLQAGRTYQIDMTSPNANVLDPYLRLEDANGREFARDDDGGGFPNAQIIFAPPATGTYVIFASSFQDNQTGGFTLSIRENNFGVFK
jgi:hypothetical protein